VIRYVLLAAYTIALLSIGITSDWHSVSESNGAMHTSLALTHVRMGLRATRGHSFFRDTRTGAMQLYSHHPPGVDLLLAAAFAATRSSSPAVARAVMIAFHTGTILLLAALLSRFFSPAIATFGAFAAATLPMSAFFGRMVNYEAPCLFAVMLLLLGYAKRKTDRSRAALALTSGAIVLGMLLDWPIILFAGALIAVELIAGRRRADWPLIATLVGATVAMAILDASHAWFAAQSAFTEMRGYVSSDWPWNGRHFTLAQFVWRLMTWFAWLFTGTGAIAFAAAFVSLFTPRWETLQRIVAASMLAPAIYVAAAPGWSIVHPYWMFYFLPAVAIALTSLAQFVWERARAGNTLMRAAAVVFVVEIIATSAHTLTRLHRTVNPYDVEQTRYFRTTFLAP
jgi:4-amino-4-deoxy-L-arabinose transferase-like glycosyltransferase